MDVKYSSSGEATAADLTATLHGAHTKEFVEPASNEKVSVERNADSGYHTGSWSETDCLTTTINDRKVPSQHIMESDNSCCLSDKTCINSSSGYTDVQFAGGCMPCGKEQINIKPSSAPNSTVSKHNFCGYNQHEHRQTDIDSNGNMVPRSIYPRTYDMTGAHIEHRAVASAYGCMPLSGSTTTIVQSTTSSNNSEYIQTSAAPPIFSTSSHGTLPETDLKISNDKLESEAQDLALKIEFCLKFGYTAAQIRAAIGKLSYKATKNDIIKELFNFSGVENGPLLAHGQVSLVEQIPSDPKFQNLVMRGISPSSQDIYQSRGPLTLESGSKQVQPKPEEDDSQNLRPIVIDGSNVAMSHGNKQYFSCKGILLAVDFFRMRNHRDITVFIPQYRKESPRPDAPITDREILDQLEQERILVYTPSRCINGKRVTCYDDRFILRLAEETDGIIVSNDNFRDLQNEKQQWKELIEKRLLMYSFVNDRFMPPDDPLGRNGPSIDNFLRKRPASEEQSKPQCPYGKKCTYGKKCKFFHPECSFPQKSVTEQLKEKSEKRLLVSKEAESLAAELVQKGSQNPDSTQPTVSNNSRRVDSPPHVMISSKDGSELIEANLRNTSNNHTSGSYGSRMTSHQQGRPTMQHNNLHEHQNHSFPFRQNQMMSHDAMMPTIAGNNQYPRSDGSLNSSFQRMNISGGAQGQVVHGSSGNASGGRSNPYVQQHCHSQRSSQGHIRFDPGPPALHVDNRHVMHPNMVQQNVPAQYNSTFPMFDGNGGMMVPPQHFAGPHNPYMHPQYVPQAPVYAQPVYDIQQHPRQVYYCNLPPGMMQAHPSIYMSSVSQGSGSSRSYGTGAASEALSTGSINSEDPKTFPPTFQRKPNRIAAAQGQHPPEPPQINDSLDNESNPRHNLFKNLCGLFPRVIVEKVMEEHPEMREPKRLIKLCLGEES